MLFRSKKKNFAERTDRNTEIGHQCTLSLIGQQPQSFFEGVRHGTMHLQADTMPCTLSSRSFKLPGAENFAGVHAKIASHVDYNMGWLGRITLCWTWREATAGGSFNVLGLNHGAQTSRGKVIFLVNYA